MNAERTGAQALRLRGKRDETDCQKCDETFQETTDPDGRRCSSCYFQHGSADPKIYGVLNHPYVPRVYLPDDYNGTKR